MQKRLEEARQIILDLGLPEQQQNDRTALCLLCLLDLTPNKSFSQAQQPLMGITPIMQWAEKHYEKKYQPNSRESFRRGSMHQFIQAGICLYNPDDQERPINSQNTVYQIEENLLALLKTFGTTQYKNNLEKYLEKRPSLIEQYSKEREMNLVPIKINHQHEIKLSAGEHSKLIKKIIEDFAPRFAPNGHLIYVGDTANKQCYFDSLSLTKLGVVLDNHGKFPDVIIHHTERNWLLLIESVTSHGPVDSKRHKELERLFANSKIGLVYVTVFQNKKSFLRFMEKISWETEVWLADAPSHMIHFNGSRFLGPY